jgi:hypothetical protein
MVGEASKAGFLESGLPCLADVPTSSLVLVVGADVGYVPPIEWENNYRRPQADLFRVTNVTGQRGDPQ